MTVDKVELHHDYIPNWPSLPGTLEEIAYYYGKIKAVRIRYYNNGERWYTIGSFKRNFTHYKECTMCIKGDDKE